MESVITLIENLSLAKNKLPPYSLGIFMVAGARHVWNISSNALNLTHEFITNLCIVLVNLKKKMEF